MFSTSLLSDRERFYLRNFSAAGPIGTSFEIVEQHYARQIPRSKTKTELAKMDIMSLLGHTTLQMTSRYTHAMPENLRTAADSLNKRPLQFRPRRRPTGIAPNRAKSPLERMECDLMSC